MATLIKVQQPLKSDCQHLDNVSALPNAGDITLPLPRWLAEHETLTEHPGRVGVRLTGADDLELLIAYLPELTLIALAFPKFTDGRGYSQARLLRERYAYQGELRAVGEVLRDQLDFMARCGIDAFELDDEQDVDTALAAFSEITVRYQPASDQVTPVYQQRAVEFYPLPIAAG